jgi:uncharacterized protein (TIGR03790 family)
VRFSGPPILAAVLLSPGLLAAQSSDNVLLVINEADSLSRRIGDYYTHKRSIPLKNVCRLSVSSGEVIAWEVYEQIEQSVGECLKNQRLTEQALYIVTTMGVPLRVLGAGRGPASEGASVDSELTLLYAKLKGLHFGRAGSVPNPFFGQVKQKFSHGRFAMYLVTRLAGYDFEDIRGVIDRSLEARNRGKFVIDLKSGEKSPGNNWLRQAAAGLPRNRVVLDETEKVLYGQTEVIGYAAWGSNDSNNKRRSPGFQWLPGAIMTEYVSTDGRTFRRPPDSWNISTWKDKEQFFAGAPQSLTADYIHEGATGASGHVDEPFLAGVPRPNYLLPAYASGRNLAESYYLAIPWLSWQNIVIGDPLCRLGRPD